MTPTTVVERAELEAQLIAARDAGYARTFEELEVGLNAIAAPVWSASGDEVAALDVSGPAHRLAADGRPELITRTRAAAEELSHRLGYRPRGEDVRSIEA